MILYRFLAYSGLRPICESVRTYFKIPVYDLSSEVDQSICIFAIVTNTNTIFYERILDNFGIVWMIGIFKNSRTGNIF